MGTLGRRAKILVIDSGFNPTAHVYPAKVKSFLPGSGGDDSIGHGTQVCRAIACQDPCNLGIAPAVDLYMAKIVVFNTGDAGALPHALEWGCQLAVDVVCMAFAMEKGDKKSCDLLDHMETSGVICVAAHSVRLPWPHREAAVVSAGRIGHQGDFDVGAPDRLLHMGERPLSGTSASCAIVAGIAACAKAFDRSMGRQAFVNALAKA